tara:strand:+ start:2083 stop:2328 length:246 start_codon:yes stop_codon:yes gene_type:complete
MICNKNKHNKQDREKNPIINNEIVIFNKHLVFIGLSYIFCGVFGFKATRTNKKTKQKNRYIKNPVRSHSYFFRQRLIIMRG